MSTILKGNLKKLGEKGPRKTWKKRFFIQRGNKLYYYVNEKSAQEKGFINLDEALAIERSEKPSNGFQIRTARRIYYLQAENQEQVEYWISGASKCLQKQSSDDNVNSQLPVQIEQAESRIADLESQNAKLKNVIDFISNQLKCSPNDVMQSFELGKALPLPRSQNNNNSGNIIEVKEHNEEVKEEVKEIKEEAKEEVKEVKEHNEEVKEEAKEHAKEVKEHHAEEHKEQLQEEQHVKEEEKRPEDVAAAEPKEHDEENKPPVIIVTSSILEEKENKLNEADEKEKDGEESDSDDDSEHEEDTQNSTHFGAQVLFEYTARKNYELSISANEVITVLSKHENGWWLGCNSKGVQGYFPGSYVRPIDN